MMAWQVRESGKSIKTFPMREQCVIWCYEMGLVVQTRHRHYLADGVEIVEVRNAKAGKQGKKVGYATQLSFAF